ncbi:MAG: recombination-associated protein RdgC [Pseudomonadota bacterium]
MFKSATVYQLTQANDAVVAALTIGLPGKPFSECGASFQSSSGFVPPLGENTSELTYEADGGILFCLRTDTKTVPASVVKMRATKIAKERSKNDEPVSPAEFRAIKEEVAQDMLPLLIAVPSWTFAYLDKTLSLLIVGAGADDADAFLPILKGAIGGRPFKLLEPETDPCINFTLWLQDVDKLQGRFELGHDCSLKHAKDGGTANISVRKDDLDGEEWAAMLEAGKQVCRIALEHNAMDFAVTASVGLRRMKLSDRLRENLDDDVEPHQYRADEFAAYVRAIRSVMRDLEEVLGGWPTQELLDLGGTQGEAA